MARKKKNIFNQIIEKSKDVETKKEEIIIEPEVKPEEVAKLLAPEIEPLIPLEIEEISLKDSGEKLAKVIKEKETEEPVEKKIEEPVVKEIVIIKPTKEQLLHLSKSGLRWYQRTGKLPK